MVLRDSVYPALKDHGGTIAPNLVLDAQLDSPVSTGRASVQPQHHTLVQMADVSAAICRIGGMTQAVNVKHARKAISLIKPKNAVFVPMVLHTLTLKALVLGALLLEFGIHRVFSA
jgi:hypothetical protein